MNEELNITKSEALDGLFKEILKETDRAMYSVYHTLDKSKDGYDCLAIQYNKETGEKTKKMFFEVVMTADYYESLFIEKKKLDLLKTLVNDRSDKIYYVNFTPRNAVIFDLLKLDAGLLFVEHVNGETAYLDATDGTAFDYTVPMEAVDEISPDFEAFPKDEPAPVKINYQEIRETEAKKEAEAEKAEIKALRQEIIEIKPVSNQIELKISDEAKERIKLDDNGEITFSSSAEFQTYPGSIQLRYVHENFLRKFLLPGENKNEMIAKYGTLEKAHLFVRERERLRFLSIYETKWMNEPNKYEIK